MNDQGELAAPTIYNGVMYVINGKWTFAIDVETGRQIWRTPVELEAGIQRAAFNRGAATIYNGKLFRVTIDNHLLALDIKTGKVLWNQTFADFREGYSSTGAPIVANGVVIRVDWDAPNNLRGEPCDGFTQMSARREDAPPLP